MRLALPVAVLFALPSAGCFVEEACLQDRDCPGAQLCLDGACRTPECEGDDDCKSPEVCEGFLCTLECTGDEECLLGQVCERNRCVPAPDRTPVPDFSAVDRNLRSPTAGETVTLESLRGKVLLLYFATAT